MHNTSIKQNLACQSSATGRSPSRRPVGFSEFWRMIWLLRVLSAVSWYPPSRILLKFSAVTLTPHLSSVISTIVHAFMGTYCGHNNMGMYHYVHYLIHSFSFFMMIPKGTCRLQNSNKPLKKYHLGLLPHLHMVREGDVLSH